MSEPTREELVDMLERMGIDVSDFDNLRTDSYEHTLARYSLEELELFYTVLRKPGSTLEEKISLCPPWPPGSRRDGEAPGRSALAVILQRINSSDILDVIGGVTKFTTTLKAKMVAAGMPNQNDVLDSVIDMVGQEVIAAKLGGNSISENLDAVDRLMMRADSKGRAALEAEKLKLRQQAETRAAEEFKFEVVKFQFDATAAAIKHAKEIKSICADKSLTPKQVMEKVQLKLFGAPPESMKDKA